MKNKYVNLTKQTAQKIVKRVLGISGSRLEKVEGTPVSTYMMYSGQLFITVQSRISEPYDRYELEVGGISRTWRIVLFTDTLDEDSFTMAKDSMSDEELTVRRWIRSFHNRTRLHRMVDYYYDLRNWT